MFIENYYNSFSEYLDEDAEFAKPAVSCVVSLTVFEVQ